jgi:transcription initiation factor IIE alpha subunit
MEKELNAAIQYSIVCNGEMALYTCEQAIEDISENLQDLELTIQGLKDEQKRRKE